MKQTFEDFLMIQHAKDFSGTKDCMVDDYPDWLENLSPDEVIEYGNMFAIEKSKGMVSIGAMVDRENATYKTGYDLGFKEGSNEQSKELLEACKEALSWFTKRVKCKIETKYDLEIKLEQAIKEAENDNRREG